MPKYRVLAIDGGGVRGLLTTMLLERLCKEPGLAQAFDRVDLVAGNSSGAFIALAIADGLKAPTILHTLGAIRTAFETPKKVFGPPRTRIALPWPLDFVPWLFASKYLGTARERAAKALFDDARLRDLKKNVLITAFDLDNSRHAKGEPPAVKNWKPKIFHNFKGPGSDEDLLARDVVLDSTAAITYFPDVNGFVDGGVYANNPSMCALAQIFDERYTPQPKPDFEDVLLFSVGAGQSLTPVRPRFGWGLLRWLWNGRIFSLMTDATVGVADYQCLQMLTQDNYHRLSTNFPEGKVIDLDAFGDVGFLQSHVDSPEVSREIEQSAEWLRAHWMPGLESPIVVPEPTSKHLGPSTELTCLMPIRQGFVPMVDTRTYATRLAVVFRILQRLRAVSREVKQTRPILDIVEAARTVNAFSWSILPGGRQLLLSVSFDRPWEPYIRVIWKDLGPLLDLFLCNCEGFVPSADGHEAFAAFVRRHQVEANFYYPASSLTIDDQKYLVEFEKSQRDNPERFGKTVATLVVSDPIQQATNERNADMKEARTQWLTVLNTLYDLRDFFPEDSADHVYLPRAAAKLLVASRPPGIDKGLPAVVWFERAMASLVGPPRETRKLDESNIQGGILYSHRGTTHGCLLMARIEDPAKARRFVARLVDFTEGQADHVWRVSRATDACGSDDRLNVAFTLAGLRQLGVTESDLRRFPKEFREGMEARAGLLGDVRTNHPENWTLPVWNVKLTENRDACTVDATFADESNRAPFGLPPIRPSTVDLVFALYKTAEVAESERGDKWTATHPLYRPVADLCVSALMGGIRIVSAQPMYRLTSKNYPVPKSKKNPSPVDHFGFVDGISQPKVSDNPTKRDDVATGELIIGFENERQDPPFPERSTDPLAWTRGSLLDCGTFLVVRKLREHVEALNRAFEEHSVKTDRVTRERLLAKMMGRTRDGKPLVTPQPSELEPNDFTFESDPTGAMCPLHSHIRRANPRQKRPDGASQPHVPRIARRSLAYGPPVDGKDDADRGIVFMAYNASIAEQFETLQRWMSGGNTPSTGKIGVYSGQPDPFLGLPDSDGKRTYRFMDDKKTISVDLGPTPLVTLQWGLYLFVPSIAALALLSKEPERDAVMANVMIAQGERLIPSLTTLGDWTALLEDTTSSQLGLTGAVLAAIRAGKGGVLRTPYGVIVASRELVMEVLRSDPDFSVGEYQNRFAKSVGKSYLGMDRGPEYIAASAGPNRALKEIEDREAFEESYRLTCEAIREKKREDSRLPPERREDERFITLPLEPVVDKVIGQLAQTWFDIPDGDLIKVGGRPVNSHDLHCPFHFLTPSRYVFSSPNPRDTVRKQGEGNGRLLLDAVRRFVEQRRERERNGGGAGLRGKISIELFRQIRDDNDLLARMLLGLAFGFAPTVYGNAMQVLGSWIGDETLWRVQQSLLSARESRGYDAATNVLRKPLVRAMLSRPVPPLLHRTVTAPRTLGGLALNKGERVVLCVGGATQEMLARGESDDVTLVFGGNRDNEPHPTHACPGYHIAMGSLLGLLSAVLHAGTLAPGPALATVKLARSCAVPVAAS